MRYIDIENQERLKSFLKYAKERWPKILECWKDSLQIRSASQSKLQKLNVTQF